MGETRVDLLHLLEDLRDAHPGSIEETILTEIMANWLDSGATRISFDCDPAQRTMTAADNGSGMQRRDLARYHDIASSTKTRGEGIGFAGVGIKLGLLVCEEVLTETRRALASRSIGYHIALAVAMALAPLAVESAHEHSFVTTFLSRWGEALDKPSGRKKLAH